MIYFKNGFLIFNVALLCTIGGGINLGSIQTENLSRIDCDSGISPSESYHSCDTETKIIVLFEW